MDIDTRIKQIEDQIEQVECDIEDLDDERRRKERELEDLENDLYELEEERRTLQTQEENNSQFTKRGGIFDSTDENQNSFF